MRKAPTGYKPDEALVDLVVEHGTEPASVIRTK